MGPHEDPFGGTSNGTCHSSAPSLLVDTLSSMPAMIELRLTFSYGEKTVMATFSQLVRKNGLRLPQVKGVICRSRVFSFFSFSIVAGVASL